MLLKYGNSLYVLEIIRGVNGELDTKGTSGDNVEYWYGEWPHFYGGCGRNVGVDDFGQYRA
jgi:hypothetical protein